MALPDYLQEAGKDYARQLTATTSAPINTGTFTGRSFVAGEDPLQTAAIQSATAGLGSYQPYLTQAQTLTGTGAGGAGSAGSIASFMSPYQTGVIDESLRMSFFKRKSVNSKLEKLIKQIEDQEISVFEASQKIISEI